MQLIMPAEWEPQERCVMAWPCREPAATRFLSDSKRDFALVARTIAEFEPVLMIAAPGFGREAAMYCGGPVDVIEIPLGTAWIRDAGPLFAIRDGEEVVAVDFRFNSWGRTLPPYAGSIGARLAKRIGMAREAVPLVLEGGAITVDGAGTLIAVEPTIRHENRNPKTDRATFERAFQRWLGIERTVWLEFGLLEDLTDGHVDNVAVFVAPGRVLCQLLTDKSDPNYERLRANRRALAEAGLDVVEIDVLPYGRSNGRKLAMPYLNFFVGNGCVVAPVSGALSDLDALALLRELFPGRDVVGVPGETLADGGGGVHCITLGQPLA